MKRDWFVVDADGLAELQMGKPKLHVLRELIANAWDEDITECKVTLSYLNGKALINVEDDNPEGFKDLADSFTLFKHTDKRKEPTQRGRFNLGEKQAFSICELAIVETTKGTVIFDKQGRTIKRSKRNAGSKITVQLKMTKKEFDELFEIKSYLVPKGIYFSVNDEQIQYKKPYKIVVAKLLTEKEDGNILKKTQRKTQLFLHKAEGNATLFEMGIPIRQIDCAFDIDIQQKVPLSIDRENVLPSFLKDVYAEVLNCTYEDIDIDKSSDLWVRTAISDERIESNAVKVIIEKRYGDKVCIANPFDKNSIDEAISSGYRVVFGSEMSGKEWDAVKKDNLIQSSTELFGKTFVSADIITDLTQGQLKVKALSKKIAKRLLNIDIKVHFVKSEATTGACFDSNNNLTFNVSQLGNNFFNNPVSAEVIDLILHELGHYEGRQHTEKRYHELLTKMAGKLIIIALEEPKFFDLRSDN